MIQCAEQNVVQMISVCCETTDNGVPPCLLCWLGRAVLLLLCSSPSPAAHHSGILTHGFQNHESIIRHLPPCLPCAACPLVPPVWFNSNDKNCLTPTCSALHDCSISWQMLALCPGLYSCTSLITADCIGDASIGRVTGHPQIWGLGLPLLA